MKYKENYASLPAAPIGRSFLSDNPLTRRAFLKRTGMASVATVALGHSLGYSTHAQAATCSCTVHNGHCHWVSALEVVFTTKTAGPHPLPAPTDPPHTQSGKIFRGTMHATISCCQGCSEYEDGVSFDVHSGGYRNTASNGGIPQGGDTVPPAGNYTPDTSLDTGIPGFDFPCPGREEMEIHGPKMKKDDPETEEDESEEREHEGRSAGCIIIGDLDKWKDFKSKMNKGACPHHPATVPMTVTYGPNAQPVPTVPNP